MSLAFLLFFFFFNDTATTEIYTLSLHDALPISSNIRSTFRMSSSLVFVLGWGGVKSEDRKSTRLNSSHSSISYAVFCLKKKKNQYIEIDCLYITKTQCEIRTQREQDVDVCDRRR